MSYAHIGKVVWLLPVAKGGVDVRANEGGGTLKSLSLLRPLKALVGGLFFGTGEPVLPGLTELSCRL